MGRDSGERHLLRVGAIGIARHEPDFFELIGDVTDGQLFAFAAGRASFEFVRGQDFDVGKQAIGRDGGQSGLDWQIGGGGENCGRACEESSETQTDAGFHMSVVAALV